MKVNNPRAALTAVSHVAALAVDPLGTPGKRQRAERIPVPAALADVALIDGKTFASAAGICLSELHDRVRSGDAPQPVIRQHRCTRWRMVDARQYLIDLATKGSADAESARRTMANARHASREAKARRAAASPAAKA